MNLLGVAVAAPLTGLLLACSSSPPENDPALDAGPTDASGAGDALMCVPTPQQEEGPFYIDEGLVQADLGKTIGVPLSLTINVIDAATCQPVAAVAVEVWHAGPLGTYSDLLDAGTIGQMFGRGILQTNGSGKVTFSTFYPGWYVGSAPHVHVKVRFGGIYNGVRYDGTNSTLAHVGQLFFPAGTNDIVRAHTRYKENRVPFVNNSDDRIYTEQHGSSSEVATTGDVAAGFTGTITIAVKRP